MPDPLCTFDLYDGFLRAAKVPEEFRLGAMREMVTALPKEHFRYDGGLGTALYQSLTNRHAMFKQIFSRVSLVKLNHDLTN